ncbi:phytanoyl-CoA dioxygenase family protein [Actinomadura litoris]|uniref:phytanoyl-CoA dioxygenase family protein n=1 Tax=Actinomadura litoris TaxID=2678616 RepID=UPI001FA6D0F9|nr:phytanoyl-CoA dioxygenase family protein [Actinomadura litoris]
MQLIIPWDRPDSARECFHRDGFVVMEAAFTPDECRWARDRLAGLFTGRFPTGTYPDEWYWREGLSRPDATRHMSNAWKSDHLIASIVQAPWVGDWIAYLNGWPRTRLGQDTIWIKPPLARPSSLHQDNSFIDFLAPATMSTCWMTFDDTHADAATIEYVPGSHLWPTAPLPADFHDPGDHRARMRASAAAAGVADPAVVQLEVPAGTIVFHNGNVWHGAAGSQRTGAAWRHTLAAHLLPADVRFTTAPGGYIYRRYQLPDDDSLRDAFFPAYPPPEPRPGRPSFPILTAHS